MTDVRLYQTVNGGEITLLNGEPVTSDGLEQAVYLSLFGGNEDDSGSDADKARAWWGNAEEPIAARQYRSETQHLLRSLAAIPANLRRVEDAAVRDLEWMTESLATSVTATARQPGLNQIELTVSIEIDDRQFQYVFTEAWRAKAA